MIFKQRKRETAVADAMVASLVVNHRSTTEIVPPDIVAHHFGLACAAANFMPDEKSARRILQAVSHQLAARCRAADELNTAIVRSTEELKMVAKASR